MLSPMTTVSVDMEDGVSTALLFRCCRRVPFRPVSNNCCRKFAEETCTADRSCPMSSPLKTVKRHLMSYLQMHVGVFPISSRLRVLNSPLG